MVWQGLLGLKNDSAACRFHFVSGNMNVATDSLPANPDGTTLPLRISQRMRLETVQLDGVARKLQVRAIFNFWCVRGAGALILGFLFSIL